MMAMVRRPIQLGRPEIAERYRKTKAAWLETRLLCAKLGGEGQHQFAQVAATCGCGTSPVFDWLKMLRDGNTRLPTRDRIVPLPSYRPVLTPCKQAWNVITHERCNHCYRSIDKLRDTLLPSLKRFWQVADAVFRLVGRSWLLDQVIASHPPLTPVKPSE